jgi:hypothetical protein
MIDVIFPVVLAVVGVAIGVPSYFTRSRRWPGMIAGFDSAKCSDVDGLTRWVGGAGMILGSVFLIAAASVYLVPQYRSAVVLIVGLASVVCPIVTTTVCGRFTRR